MFKKLDAKYIVIFIVFICLLFCLIPRLNCNEEIVLDVGNYYNIPNCEFKYLFTDFSDKLNIEHNIDITKIGDYKINYFLPKIGLKSTKTVKVIDKKNPTIILKGENSTNVCPNKIYNEEGYKATDNYDLDLTDKVIVTSVDNNIIYTVNDSSNNITTIERKINYIDDENPNITLYGSSNINIYQSYDYFEKGYEASDNCDGNLTNKVTIESNVNTKIVGTYYITYSVSDSSGNTTKVTRTVNVINRPLYTVTGNSTIYLTFDDGPSYAITPYILNILKEENVKATFFVVGYSSGLDSLIKRAYDEGHSIGVHSASHVYNQIYSSLDNYLKDFNIVNERIKNITGSYTKIFRFPGGSSNTISRFNPGIMSYLTSYMTSKGYKYFDWNLSSGDASNIKYNAEGIYNNVVRNLKQNQLNMVLMHDLGNKYSTLNALRNIIKYGKDHGYSFEKITYDTPQIRHSVNN